MFWAFRWTVERGLAEGNRERPTDLDTCFGPEILEQ